MDSNDLPTQDRILQKLSYGDSGLSTLAKELGMTNQELEPHLISLHRQGEIIYSKEIRGTGGEIIYPC